MRNWLLPEYIEDILPAQATRLEKFRRQLLDLFHVHGYQYVIPPMLEYTESLMTGTAHDLSLATFKVVDQLTGRLMGLRADMTPQVARIDAHMLNHQGVSRLCYAGTVLKNNPSGLARTREPMQVGAELFGHEGIESDLEVQQLMIKALQCLGVEAIQVDLSHVGIFESIVDSANISPDLELELYAALQNKDQPQLKALSESLDATTQQAIIQLTELNGGVEVIATARAALPKLDAIDQALNKLEKIANKLSAMHVGVSIDLSELRGYHYHSGFVFAAYAKGYTGPVALGGRYDKVGESFGRARPATGFSLDLRGVMQALSSDTPVKAILAPAEQSLDLLDKIDALRASGEVVIQALPDSKINQAELNCDRKLEKQSDTWQVVPF